MTKSLNQAFIKAYSKENVSSERPPKTEAAHSNVPDLVMRFDTASIQVPSPHTSHQELPVNPPRPTETQPRVVANQSQAGVKRAINHTKEGQRVPPPKLSTKEPQVRRAEVVYSEPSQQHAVATPPMHTSSSDSAESDAAAIRNSIASQMMQAGDWNGLHLDAFFGAGVTDTGFTESQQNSPTTNHASTSKVFAEAAQQDNAERVLAERIAREQSNATHAQAKPNLTPAPTPESVPDLSAPKAPAIDPSSSVHQRTHSESGEIFRLDKPSYYTHAGTRGDGVKLDDASDSGVMDELSSEASKTAIDIPPIPSKPSSEDTGRISRNDRPSGRPAKSSNPIEVEKRLREAKERIFNPVWEVDSLHWPNICFELLSQSGEQMDAVAQNLVSACEEGLQIMAVTSPQGGEGRTTIACCLAILAGSRGLKVAIVDGDLESPSLSLQTNLDVEQDWRTAIEHQLPLEEVSIHSIDDQVTVVPLVRPVPHNELSPDDDRIASMLQELADSFDLVIVDMGHMSSPRSLVSTMGEYGVLSAVVAVIDQRETSAEQIDACIRRIRQAGIVSIGLVDNFAA